VLLPAECVCHWCLRNGLRTGNHGRISEWRWAGPTGPSRHTGQIHPAVCGRGDPFGRAATGSAVGRARDQSRRVDGGGRPLATNYAATRPDVPSAPSRSSTLSKAMPWWWIAALSDAVLAPGSQDASLGAGSGFPSVCAISYLGIPQPGHGNAVVAERGHSHDPNSRCPWRRRLGLKTEMRRGQAQPDACFRAIHSSKRSSSTPSSRVWRPFRRQVPRAGCASFRGPRATGCGSARRSGLDGRTAP